MKNIVRHIDRVETHDYNRALLVFAGAEELAQEAAFGRQARKIAHFATDSPQTLPPWFQ